MAAVRLEVAEASTAEDTMACTRGSNDVRLRRVLPLLAAATLVACHGPTDDSPGTGPRRLSASVSRTRVAALQDAIAKSPQRTHFSMQPGVYPFQSSTSKAGMTFHGEAGR